MPLAFCILPQHPFLCQNSLGFFAMYNACQKKTTKMKVLEKSQRERNSRRPICGKKRRPWGNPRGRPSRVASHCRRSLNNRRKYFLNCVLSLSCHRRKVSIRKKHSACCGTCDAHLSYVWQSSHRFRGSEAGSHLHFPPM
jgi:hypothetical protein